jgi:hypothetical protein
MFPAAPTGVVQGDNNMPKTSHRAKASVMKSVAEEYPKLNATLHKIEGISHALELTDGRYAYTKYLNPIYAFYRRSKEKRTRKRDRTRICKLRGLKVREDVCLFGVLILATSKVSKSTRGKYVAKLRQAVEEDISPQDFREFVKRPRKAIRRERTLPSIVPRLPLKRQGYVLDVHPACGHPTRKPDFLAKKQDQTRAAIVEVTTFTPATPEVSQSKRDADVYNALDKAKLPAGWRLGLDIVKHGELPASLNKIRSDVEKWAVTAAGDDPLAMPEKTFDYEGWSIDLTLYGGFRKDVPAERAIASAMGNIREIDPALEIRQAVEGKGRRYGAMTDPYLIVVADCKQELAGGDRNGDALVEAMFGKIVTQASKDENGKLVLRDVRQTDGYWGTPDAPKHRGVSGILLLPKPHLWDLRETRWQPLLVRNSWAERALPDDLLPLPGFKHVKEAQYAATDGTALPIFSICRSLGLLKEHDGGMNFDGLIRFAPPPPNRVRSCAGEYEANSMRAR